jgi:hypothetical protein
VVRLVGDQQRRRGGAAFAVQCRLGGQRRIRDRDPVPVARLGPGGVRSVRLQVDAVARGVERLLAADVRGRCHHRDAGDAPRGQHLMRDVQSERGLAGGGRGGGEEGVAVVAEDGGGGRPLPGA